MKRKLLIVVTIALGLVAAGWLAWPHVVNVLAERAAARNRQANTLPGDALHALVSDPKLTLFSINPDRREVPSPDVPKFQGWNILGQTTTLTAEQRHQLSTTLQHGLSRWSGHSVSMCFSPRHALRATEGSRTYDFLICFECGWLNYYPPGEKVRRLKIRTKPGPFNEILLAAQVPMPRQPAK